MELMMFSLMMMVLFDLPLRQGDSLITAPEAGW